MRAFIVLSLIALASAANDGYNYQAGGGDGAGAGGAGIGGGLSGSGGCGSSGGSSCGGGLFGGDNSGASSNLSPSFAGNNGGGFGAGQGAGAGPDAGAGDAGFGGQGGLEKEFYSFSANDAEFEPTDASEQIANSLKQNLRVVFIKGPENHGLEDAAVNLAKHASDQRTAIYVLNKQADIGSLANKLNQLNNQNHNKPEVHFVKYRTPEDAHNAQSQIQNQYASLGGSSQSHDGGVAPVLDFASKGSSSNVHSVGGYGAGAGGYPSARPSNTYVPPANTYVPPAAVPVNSYIPPAAPGNTYIPPSRFRSLRL